jgi:hypothetical protein
MNDEQLIWEAYTTKRNKKQQQEYNKEFDAVYYLRSDEYQQWRRKGDSLDMYSPEYRHHSDIETAIEERSKFFKQKFRDIEIAINKVLDNPESAGVDKKTAENIDNAFCSSYLNIGDEGYDYESPSYYEQSVRGLDSQMADGTYTTPEVREWYKTKFGIVG